MTRTVVIAAGGSGGHLLPARELARRLSEQIAPENILWMVYGLDKSPFFDETGFRYLDIEAAPISWKPKALCSFLWHSLRGYRQAKEAMQRNYCSMVVGFGSYHTVPVMAAARSLAIPYILHAADSIPGRVIRLYANKALTTSLQLPAARSYLRGHVTAVKPFAAHQLGIIDREEALSYLGLEDKLPTLLVAGGSQGAKAVNGLVQEVLFLLQEIPFQVIHLTGSESCSTQLKSAYQTHNIPASVKAFENNMAAVWACADLYLGRSGATTIAELCQAALPAIFIPFPYAKDDHQWHNAHFYSDKAIGWILRQDEMTPMQIATLLKEILGKLTSYRKECVNKLASYCTSTLPTLDELVLSHWRKNLY